MEEHPNIDSLRAFAAEALEKDEHRRVLAHLVQCERCRGLLALMTPEEGPPPLLSSQPADSKTNKPKARQRFKK